MSEQLLMEIRAVGKKVDAISTQLLGAPDAETKHGRLPRLEATVEDHGCRIDALEEKETHREGLVHGVAAVGATVGAIVSALIAWIVHAFELVKK